MPIQRLVSLGCACPNESCSRRGSWGGYAREDDAQLQVLRSRALNDFVVDAPGRKRWARHGSTRWLRERDGIAAAIRYVVYEQGTSMAVYEQAIA